jgi:prenyl protein peptidase
MIEVLINFLFACIFVGSLYITPVRIRKLSHNNPIQIKQRSISIFISCLLCLLFVYYWCSPIETTAGKSEVKFYPSSHQFPVYILLGIRINGLLTAAILPLLLTVILFSGAITCHICEYVIYKDIDGVNEYDKKSCLTYLPSVADIGKSIVSYFSNWPNIRNTIIAPICEEFVFRSCMAAMMLHSKRWSIGTMILVLPLFFGVAHAHHFYRLVCIEKYNIKRALLQCIFQFTYTTLFGIYATFIYMRTGHLIAAILCHCFCNWNGFPDLGWLTNENDLARPHIKLIGSTYIVGIILFYFSLYPLTNPIYFDNQLFYQHFLLLRT